MGEIVYFVPGEPDKPAGLLSGHFYPIPGAVVAAYLQAYTRPGDLVLDPFCEGPTVLRQAVCTGRSAIASSFNPLAVMAARLSLSPPERRQLDAAITRLGDAPRLGVPLSQYLQDLYAVRCPRCGRSTPADAFVWERDSATLSRIDWQCRHCAHQSVAPSSFDSPAFEERGLHYWHTLERIAPRGEPLHERAQQWLELYTPRNLHALSNLLLKIESLFDGEVQQTLKLLLLACLDACSSLCAPESPGSRHRLRPPARFVERNVWRAFLAAADALNTAVAGAPFPLADDPQALLADAGMSRAVLLPLGVNRLAVSLLPGRVALVVTAPPRPDPAFWALSWLWSSWLFGPQAAAPLKPLLRHWRVDWDWYTRTMQAAFRTLRPLLTDGAPLILAFDSPEASMIEALALALSGAGYSPASWIQQADSRAYRLAARCTPSLPSPPSDVGGLADAICAETSVAARELIAARGEPLTWDELRLPVYRRLAASGLLGQAAVAQDLPAPPRAFVAAQIQDALGGAEGLVHLEGTAGAEKDAASARPACWWLPDPAAAAPPLDTRVEATVHQLLLSTLVLTGEALTQEVYRHFAGDLTPDASLIETCLRSYGHEITPGHWQLRLEDQPDRRAEEVSGIRQALHRLGQRLGFEVSQRPTAPEAPAPGPLPAFDVLWRDEGQPTYAFAIQWTARVHDLLLAEAPAGVRPYLVIPGGRAALVALKLQRDPRLRQAVGRGGWQFIKYRHLRRILAEENLDRHVLKQIAGLDPIIERDSAQMPLF